MKNKAVYRTLNQDGDKGLIAAGFMYYPNPNIEKEIIPRVNYTGFLLLTGLGSCLDSKGNNFPLLPGCFFHCFPTETYTLEINPDTPWTACYLTFGSPLCQGLLDSGILDPNTPLLQPGLENNFPDKFEELLQYLNTATNAELPQAVPTILSLLLKIKQLAQKNSSSNSYSAIVTRVAATLATSLDKKIDIKELLKDQPLSYDRFRFIFKQELGVSPGIYRINKKMECARELLTSGKYKVYQVAEMLGYPDAYSFSKQFSRFVGISPKNYSNFI